MRLFLIVFFAFLMQVNSIAVEPTKPIDVLQDLQATTQSDSNSTTVPEITTVATTTIAATEGLTTEETITTTTDVRKSTEGTTPGVLISKLLEAVTEAPTTTKSKRSYELVQPAAPLSQYSSNVARFTRDATHNAPQHVNRPLSFVKPTGYKGEPSGCSCYCPPSSPCGQNSEVNVPFNHHVPVLPAPQHKFRAAENEDEIEDSLPSEAHLRSAYAQEPTYSKAYYAELPQPAYVEPPKPAYVIPPPPQQYTYPSPAPQVSCGQNLLVGCAPTVSHVPCGATPYTYQSNY